MPSTLLTKPGSTFDNPLEQGLIDYHRLHLKDGTFLSDDQGVTTVNITGVTGPDGRIYNVPGYWEGKRRTEKESRDRAEKVGWENFPSYATGPESNEAAQRLHQIIEQDFGAWQNANAVPAYEPLVLQGA